MTANDDRLDQLDYYTLLGLEPTATVDEVRKAFRKFARRYHPDRFVGAARDKIERATRIYRRGSEAWQVLTDPEARRAYDRALGTGALRISLDAVDRARAESAAPRPSSPPPFRTPTARAFHDQARALARSGDLRAAWRSLKSALEAEPDNKLLQKRLHQLEAKLRQG